MGQSSKVCVKTSLFQELPSPALLHEAVYAFKAAVQQTASEEVPTKYKVIGSKGKSRGPPSDITTWSSMCL